jgi:protoporphyrinogen oxidase
VKPERTPIVVLGAGPAGLGAALRLARRGVFDVTVIERRDTVGGNAGSFEVGGLRVDYGSHRLHPSCRPEILADIRGMLGGELLDRPRHGRILLRGRWVHFPLNPMDLALHLPVTFALGVLRDAAVKGSRGGDGESFATVLERGLASAGQSAVNSTSPTPRRSGAFHRATWTPSRPGAAFRRVRW